MIAALALAAALDLLQYRAQLERIDALLARGENARAAAAAQRLQEATLRAGDQDLAPDAWSLGPIARGEPHRARLRALLQSLGAEGPPGRAPDPALLEEVRRAQAPSVPAAGGEIGPLELPGRSLWDLIRSWGSKLLDAIDRAIVRFFRWLRDLFRPPGPAPEKGESITAAVLAGVGVILALLAGAALLSLRGRGRAAAAVRRPERPAVDEDPGSRTVSGWEQRAGELAAQGRHREAIRAWYHAVLARCASAGVLHLRRGRTNWEYAYALPPSVPGRGRFEDLTQRFDVEWYGHAESTGEALAAFADGASGILRSLGQRA